MVGAVHEFRGTYNVTDYRWFDLRDHNTSSANFQHHYGLLRDDYSPKPAFCRLSELIARLAGAAAGSDEVQDRELEADQMVNFKKLTDRAKDVVDKRGGTDALKADAKEVGGHRQGQGLAEGEGDEGQGRGEGPGREGPGPRDGGAGAEARQHDGAQRRPAEGGGEARTSGAGVGGPRPAAQ